MCIYEESLANGTKVTVVCSESIFFVLLCNLVLFILICTFRIFSILRVAPRISSYKIAVFYVFAVKHIVGLDMLVLARI
jgi:hypothetical protein